MYVTGCWNTDGEPDPGRPLDPCRGIGRQPAVIAAHAVVIGDVPRTFRQGPPADEVAGRRSRGGEGRAVVVQLGNLRAAQGIVVGADVGNGAVPLAGGVEVGVVIADLEIGRRVVNRPGIGGGVDQGTVDVQVEISTVVGCRDLVERPGRQAAAGDAMEIPAAGAIDQEGEGVGIHVE